MAVLLGALLASLGAHAQDEETDDAGLEFGGGRWRPAFEASYQHSTNFYNRPVEEQDSSGVLLRPRMDYLTEAGRLSLNSSLDAEYGAFDLPGSEDDYLDANIRAHFGYLAGTRHRLDLSGGLRHDHDPFGVDRTEDASARDEDLDRWNLADGRLGYRFGALGAAINTEIAVLARSKTYISNENFTAPLSHDAVGAEYVLSYNYSPKTAVLLDLSRTDIEFDRPFPGQAEHRDGQLYRAHLGARWLATGKTSGDVRIGVRRRAFDGGAEPLQGLDWQAGVKWSARAKTLVELRTYRADQESYVSSSGVIDLKTVALSVRERFTTRFTTTLRLDQTQARFINTPLFAGTPRRDDLFGATLGVEYLMRPYLYLTASAQYIERESTVFNRDYDRVNSYIGFRLGR